MRFQSVEGFNDGFTACHAERFYFKFMMPRYLVIDPSTDEKICPRKHVLCCRPAASSVLSQETVCAIFSVWQIRRNTSE